MDDTLRTAAAATVQPRVQQAYDLHLELNFVAGRDALSTLALGCQPRHGAQRVNVDPVDLPPSARRWLVDVNKAMVAWLARDASHQAAFVADPLAAMAQAGLKLERGDAKAIARLRETLGSAEAVTPGLQVRSVRTAADPKGRVKPVDDGGRWTPPAPAQPCHCDNKGN